jgi:hypothetical protein
LYCLTVNNENRCWKRAKLGEAYDHTNHVVCDTDLNESEYSSYTGIGVCTSGPTSCYFESKEHYVGQDVYYCWNCACDGYYTYQTCFLNGKVGTSFPRFTTFIGCS